MRRLMLLRHAKTERDSPTGKDRDRRLDDRGERDAREIGEWLAQNGYLPGLALVSTAVRARQTWDAIANLFPQTPAEHLSDLYSADPSALLTLIHAANGNPEQLLVIAHNPGLHELALGLLSSGEAGGRRALSDNLPTSGFVAIDFPVDDWRDVSFRRGKLEQFVTPKLLKEGFGSE